MSDMFSAQGSQLGATKPASQYEIVCEMISAERKRLSEMHAKASTERKLWEEKVLDIEVALSVLDAAMSSSVDKSTEAPSSIVGHYK